MFIGHFALGLAASRTEKQLPLGTALIASQLPDALWPLFLLAGVETVSIVPGDTAMTPLRFESYPWSHSLLMVAIWGALFTFVYLWSKVLCSPPQCGSTRRVARCREVSGP